MNKDSFKEIMSLLANGVSVLTCRVKDENFGITISSLTSVGINPPTIAVCVEGRSPLVEAIREVKVFGLSMLEESQKELGVIFSNSELPYERRFECSQYTLVDNCPVIDGCLASLICDTVHEVEISDNVVFFGQVRRGKSFQGRPLVYFRRNWQSTSAFR